MHYYQFHIGDYRAATAHLSNEEDLAFRRLIDMYYDTEKPIPLDTHWVSRRLRVGIDTLVTVLNDMFVHTDDGWMHSRCDAEIAHYHDLAQKNRENGKKGGRPKKPSGLPVETDSEPKKSLTKNQEPRTNNHKPIRDKATVVATPEGVSQSVWDDFVKHRKTKKAQVTQTVIDGIAREAQKAGWSLDDALRETIVRNWASFKADWVAVKQAPSNKRLDAMNQLTRGMATPKPFWEKSNNVIEVQDVERKRLL